MNQHFCSHTKFTNNYINHTKKKTITELNFYFFERIDDHYKATSPAISVIACPKNSRQRSVTGNNYY